MEIPAGQFLSPNKVLTLAANQELGLAEILVPSAPAAGWGNTARPRTGEAFKHFCNSSAEDSSALRKLAPIYLQTPHVVKVQRHTARFHLSASFTRLRLSSVWVFLHRELLCMLFSPPCFAKLDENKAKPGGTTGKGGKDSSTSPKMHTHRRRSALNLGSQVRLFASPAAPLLNICHSQV